MLTGNESEQVVSTGISGLDQILSGLRIGDNVVWRVEDIDDYRRFVTPFVAAAVAQGRSIIYLRFGHHSPLVEEGQGVRVVRVDALRGFEAFTRHVWQLVAEYGRGAFYVCDCLTDLQDAWATDHMVGNFFRVICPFLYELDTVAYFALYPRAHSQVTLARIRDTTQVLIDVHRAGNESQIQPVKVWERQSPTMFLPHRQAQDQFIPVTDSSDATRLQALIELRHGQGQQLLDHWDQLFLNVSDPRMLEDDAAQQACLDQILPILISRDSRMLTLAQKYLSLEDLLAIRSRMIGSGYIGGKAAGMLLARAILLREDGACWQQRLEPHDSYYLGSDVYYAFLVHNRLWANVMLQRTASGYFEQAPLLRQAVLEGEIPQEIRQELERMLDHFGQYPILVRSSSLLEDGFGNAFAGKYESVFLVNQGSPEQRLTQLEQAIRQVYASSFSEDALVYRQQRGLADLEEPMALLLQRVNGRYQGQYYLPDAAGVGVSRNTFAWDADMDPAAGMVRLVMGLGTRAVDRIEGDHACVVALDYPHKRPFRNRDEAYRFSQSLVDLLNVADNQLQSRSLMRLSQECPHLPLSALGELDREATERARQLPDPAPVWRLTFDPLLRRTEFVPLLRNMLTTLEQAYEHPVDVEFTVHLGPDGEPTFNLVQCRPLAVLGPSQQVTLPEQIDEETLYFRTEGHFMGGNMDIRLDRVVQVDARQYAGLSISQKYEVAKLIGQICRADEERSTVLIGPGRWGTSSPELGVPVRFADISRIAVLVEVAEMGAGMVPDLSFGSHFFQDLVESSIAYVALFPNESSTHYHPQWLSSSNVVSLSAQELCTDEDEFDDAVSAVVRIYDLSAQPLRLVADVVSQRLLCYQADGG
ncbi:PEP/pyruvate-binding domain-containing protein [Nitrincola sp. MINF-07-Sa-05]|uniref:PEP/pyruvate-binding domain-containing protein n=1 Tax=Nitrincola salilacus TaxID=3400273 RepID=UPI003917CDC8